MTDTVSTRCCTSCKQHLPRERFGLRKPGVETLRPCCRSCESERSTKYQKQNEERLRVARHERYLKKRSTSISRPRRTRNPEIGSRAHIAWGNMKTRCNNPRSPRYKDYGGRGIRICERWTTFANFLADMGQPSQGMSLDRIDVDGNYEPSNCRWADIHTQANNKRRSKAYRKA